jgi:hypothetical protein
VASNLAAHAVLLPVAHWNWIEWLAVTSGVLAFIALIGLFGLVGLGMW